MNGRIGVFAALLSGVTACHESVEDCPHFPSSDCCSVSSECFEFYGDAFPFCARPDHELGGTCSECLRDGDCNGGQVCLPLGGGQSQCVDPGACYNGTPWPGETDC